MESTDIKLDNEQGSTKSKKGKIIYKIIIAIMIVGIVVSNVPAMILLFVHCTDKMNSNIEKELVKNQAEQIVTAKLKEKYPERSFEITDIYVDVSPYYFGGSSVVDKNNVYVHIKENNEEYTIIVNCNNKTIIDIIQSNETTKGNYRKNK